MEDDFVIPEGYERPMHLDTRFRPETEWSGGKPRGTISQRGKKFRAQITVEKRKTYIGTFPTREEAEKALYNYSDEHGLLRNRVRSVVILEPNPTRNEEMHHRCIEMELGNGLTTLIDEDDAEFINQCVWCAEKTNARYGGFRPKGTLNGKTVYLARLVGRGEYKRIVYENNKPLDVRRKNLRHGTKKEYYAKQDLENYGQEYLDELKRNNPYGLHQGRS